MTPKQQIEFTRSLRKLENDAKVLYRIRKVTNELKSNNAYSSKNIELEFKNLENAHASEYEKQIISDTWDMKRKIAIESWKELEELIKIFNGGETNKTSS